MPAIQLGHSGRKASAKGPLEGRVPLAGADVADGRSPWPTISASAIAEHPDASVPRAMDRGDIATVVKAWGEAARRAVDAGYDVCEIHGAHGYLIHQFLSPVSNLRTDAYGGDRQGRMRLALEITEEVRRAWPDDRPLFFRVSAIDGPGGSWVMDDTLVLAGALRERGVDVVDCSSGGIRGGTSDLPVVPRVPGYQVGYAKRVRERCGMPTMVSGFITDPWHAEAILQEGSADLVALSRGMMDDPNWAVHAAQVLGADDPLALFPAPYAFRLGDRERAREAYAAAADVAIPFSHKERVPYVWPRAFAEGTG